jgi:hypothetical protein
MPLAPRGSGRHRQMSRDYVMRLDDLPDIESRRHCRNIAAEPLCEHGDSVIKGH